MILGGRGVSESPGSKSRMTSNAKQFEPDPRSFLAMRTLESQLEGEHWFLERVRATLRTTLRLPDNVPLPAHRFKTLLTKNGHDSLIHVAQFYYFLSALSCVTPEAIELFIKSHNDQVAKNIEDGALTKEGARRKAIFNKTDITNVRLTFIEFGEPIFAVTELGKLLSDLMSSGTTTTLIHDLVAAGVFEQIAGPRIDGTPKTDAELDISPMETDPRRKLVKPTAGFLRDYEASLLITHDRILASG